MKKQTAFQYYMQQHNIIARLGDNISIAERFKLFDELIQKTKQMEKEQMIEFAEESLDYLLDYNEDCILLTTQERIEQFYNETYGGKK